MRRVPAADHAVLSVGTRQFSRLFLILVTRPSMSQTRHSTTQDRGRRLIRPFKRSFRIILRNKVPVTILLLVLQTALRVISTVHLVRAVWLLLLSCKITASPPTMGPPCFSHWPVKRTGRPFKDGRVKPRLLATTSLISAVLQLSWSLMHKTGPCLLETPRLLSSTASRKVRGT